MKKLSIITIVYNGEKYIKSTIESVIHQNYPNIEYIIIDGGSSDQTLNIINTFQKTAYLKLISEKDKGISDAFNKGLKLATGDVVGLINADDWYESGAFMSVMKEMDNPSTDIVYGDMRYHTNQNQTFIKEGKHERLKYEMTVNHPTVFVKRRCYVETGYFNLNYKCAMDYDLMLRFLKNNYSFKHLPIIISNMRLEGLSDQRWMMGIKEVRDIKTAHFGNAFWNHLYMIKQAIAIVVSKTRRKLFLK